MTMTETATAARRGVAALGALDPHSAAAPDARWRRRVAFGWRAMLKIKHVPMQLFDVTAFPIMFVLLYTYLFGGALAGSPQRVPPGPAARHPGA